MRMKNPLKRLLMPIRGERGIALVLALLVTALLLILGGHFMAASLTEHTIAANEVDAARAFYAADAGIEHAKKSLEGLAFSGVLDGTDDLFAGKGKGKGKGAGSSAVIVGATYTVQVSNNIVASGFPRGTIAADPSNSDTVDGDNIIVLTSTGAFETGQQTIEAVIQSGGGFLPTIPGAIVQVSNGWNDADVGGLVSGFDEPGTCPDQAGHFHRGGKVIIEGNTVVGDPPSRNFDPAKDDPIWDDPDAVVAMIEKWMNDPKAVTITSDTPPATLGTAANPQITVWDPKSKDTDQGASFTGYGILIVVGRVNLKTAFEFHGLIIAYGGKEMAIEGGNGQVLHGAILAANNAPSPSGEATEVGVLNGTKVNYNCDALEKYVKPISGGSSSVKVLSWRRP